MPRNTGSGARAGWFAGAALCLALGVALGVVAGPSPAIGGIGQAGGATPEGSPGVSPAASPDASPGASPAATPTGAIAGLLPVDGIEILVLESFPVQIRAVVRGYLPDGCTEAGQPSQTRTGNVIEVTIPTSRPADLLCTQAIVPVELTVPLDGPFPPGDYTVVANGVAASFTV